MGYDGLEFYDNVQPKASTTLLGIIYYWHHRLLSIVEHSVTAKILLVVHAQMKCFQTNETDGVDISHVLIDPYVLNYVKLANSNYWLSCLLSF